LIAFSETTSHGGSGLATSASWKLGRGALYPNNWLITPAITLESHSTLTYYVGVQNINWPDEHYGVYISTTDTDINSFSLLHEETMTASPGYQGEGEITAKDASLSNEPQYVQGAWKKRTVDLSAYAGQTVYIAFRHFNTVDKWQLNLDDVKITYEGVNAVFDVYANGELIADNLTETRLDLAGVTPGDYNYCVVAVYGSVNESDPVCASVTVENPYKPVTNLEVRVSGTDLTIDWESTNEDKIVTLFKEDFENGIPSSWKNMDVDDDGEKWYELLNTSIVPHNGVGLVTSASYNAAKGALFPDNWLIAPAVQLRTNSALTYYVGAQDANWPNEHYGVYISTTGTDINSFSLLYEETMTASPGYQVNGPVSEDAFRSDGPQYVQGAWYERNIDLSAYAGQMVYIAFRHFNTVDKFRLNLDDVKVTSVISHDVVFDVYANNELIANDLIGTHLELTGVAPGNYNYCVIAVYDSNNESEQACREVEVIDPHHPVRNLTIETIEKTGTLTWEIPIENSNVLNTDNTPNYVIPVLSKYIVRRDGLLVDRKSTRLNSSHS
jgi:hypothetical protein